MKKYALVTGADRGLGFALTKNLLSRGYTVFAGQFMPEWPELDNLKLDFEESLITLPLDVSSDESVKFAADKIKTLCPSLDILINNAGIAGDKVELDDAELNFDKMLNVINVNAIGTLRVTNALVSHVLKSNEKLIIDISSEAASIANCKRKTEFGYCMSKASVNMQGAIVYNAIKDQGGKLILFHPGWVISYMGGTLSTKAKYEAVDCAKGVLEVALDSNLEFGDRPIYKTFEGKDMPW